MRKAEQRAFTDTLRRLLRVPKHEVDEEERKHREEQQRLRATRQRKKSA